MNGAADQLAREAQEFLAHGDSDYAVQIDHAGSYNWFYLRVRYRDGLIYNKPCCRSFVLARLRVRRTIRHHRRFIAAMHKEGVHTRAAGSHD